ncbi:hypothetical protein D3C78_1684180 [compost metagenome]
MRLRDDRGDRTVGYLHDGTAVGHALQQFIEKLDTGGHGEIQHRHGGDDAVEHLALVLAKRRIEIEGVAIDEIDARIAPEQLIVEIGRIFDGGQVLRLDAARQNGLGDDAGAGAEF